MPKAAPRTLQELAQRLHLSVTTVSLVLGGRARALRISPRTEERIRRAAERYRLQPNPLAAGLRSGRTASVGLVVPDIANPFFAVLVQQLEHALRRLGRVVLLADSQENPAIEERSLADLRQRRVDGLIVAPVAGTNPLLARLAAEGFPLVCLDRVSPDLPAPQVASDHAGAARLAVEALLQRGHRRIGCLRGHLGVYSDDERVRGYRAALEAAGIHPAATWIDGGDFTRETARAAAERLLVRGEITGLVSLAGQATVGLLEAVRQRGVRCPAALSIVAFDEQPWSGLVDPPLTTIAQPVAQMVGTAVEMLQQRLDGLPAAPSPRLPCRLVPRASVAAPPRGRRGSLSP